MVVAQRDQDTIESNITCGDLRRQRFLRGSSRWQALDKMGKVVEQFITSEARRLVLVKIAEQALANTSSKCLRPYHDENTRSRPITEVKHRRAGIVLGWGTAWELPVS